MVVRPGWVDAARARAQRPPARPRLPFAVGGHTVGSVDAQVFGQIAARRLLDERWQLSKEERSDGWAWQLGAADVGELDATDALNALARVLRATGHCGPWRDEQLAVCDAAGRRIGTVERGAVRPLGITTRAVHLVAATPEGDLWVQQRAFSKPSNPGMWDTTMGGMVSAADTLEQALARETWEEAGLAIDTLQRVAHGGHVDFARPCEAGGDGGDGGGEGAETGYMQERIDWFSATVPAGTEPVNQDGEVERFEAWPAEEVQARLAAGAFTPEAALVLAGYYGW
ncbi:NUDIX domain-containing protein [Acidovorax sp. FG27]